MKQRLSLTLIVCLAMLAAALPALAQEEDPLANSVFLADIVGWIMAGLAVVMMLLLVLWARRDPQ